MTRRQDLKECFVERLENTINDVQVILNQIERLESKYTSISKKVIRKELAASYCDLELSMALMAVIIRKMVENQFITITSEQRHDINALIHSNRFDYRNGKVLVYSRLSQESVDVDYFLHLGEKIVKELN